MHKMEYKKKNTFTKQPFLACSTCGYVFGDRFGFPIMIARNLGYSEQLTYLFRWISFMCGVATFPPVQLNKYFGIGFLSFWGVAFQSVTLIMIGQNLEVVPCLVPSLCQVSMSFWFRLFSKVADLFPSALGSVITTIGLTLIPVAIGNMGNNVEKPTAQKFNLRSCYCPRCLLINIFTKALSNLFQFWLVWLLGLLLQVVWG